MGEKKSISRREFIQNVGVITTGIMTNPTLGSTKKEEYERK